MHEQTVKLSFFLGGILRRPSFPVVRYSRGLLARRPVSRVSLVLRRRKAFFFSGSFLCPHLNSGCGFVIPGKHSHSTAEVVLSGLVVGPLPCGFPVSFISLQKRGTCRVAFFMGRPPLLVVQEILSFPPFRSASAPLGRSSRASQARLFISVRVFVLFLLSRRLTYGNFLAELMAPGGK